MRRVLLPAVAAAVLLGASVLARAAVAPAEEEARRFVQQTIDDVLGVLHDSSLTLDQKKDRVEAIAYERFDFELICRFVLARNWNTMSEQQQHDFVDAFKKHLSATYRDTLDSFSDEKILVDGSQPEARGDVTVKTIVRQGSGDTRVDYRLRKTDAGWRGIDVIIEGVSLVQNFRTQCQEIISAEGADALIQKLRDKQIQLDPKVEKG
ncbi:MAG: ABC transporter substrate-binding protein [Deltaproteobacteria bacterium]|nr:ABC transporter substrate-binding protein [Deltaproteobacteria bacterium]